MEITIKWSYPREFNSACACEHADERGIYQISRKFGDNETLLYIGLVKSSKRDFSHRIKEHLSWLNEYRGQKIIRFGKIICLQKVYDLDLIEEVEGALIYQLKPFENTMKKQSYKIRKDLIINNIGYRGYIPQTIDTKNH